MTSPDGAALHDIIAVLRRRGAERARRRGRRRRCRATSRRTSSAARSISVNRWGGADLVIVGRGGGSREDLWAFNDERVARAVAACHVPTISAVGHEIDISICDLVADHRAPTPSAAAEAATPSLLELRGELRKLALRVSAATRSTRALAGRSAASPRSRPRPRRLDHSCRVRQTALETIAGRLNALSPLATLARGYAVARGRDGATLGSAAAFHDGMAFDLIVRDGVVPARRRPATPTESAP